MTRVLGDAGPGGTEHAFVVDAGGCTDDRLRAVALCAGVLWDWNIVCWDAGGG